MYTALVYPLDALDSAFDKKGTRVVYGVETAYCHDFDTPAYINKCL
jgi:hypothetical protein